VTIGRAEIEAVLAARDWARVFSSLSDLETLEARCRSSLRELLEDFAFVLRRAPGPMPAEAFWNQPSGARLDRDALALLETVLDANRDALLHAPARLFPIVYNAIYWVDAPERAEHFDGAHAPSARQLWKWMEHWRKTFEARPEARWLRCVGPPRPDRTSVRAWRVVGGTRALNRDGVHLLVNPNSERRRAPLFKGVASPEGLELLDARTGRSLAAFPGCHRTGGFSPGGESLLLLQKRIAQLVRLDTLSTTRELGPMDDYIEHAAFSSDGSVVLTASYTEVRAWRVDDGSCLGTLGPLKYVNKLLPVAEGNALVCGQEGWKLWSYSRGSVLAAQDYPGDQIYAIALSPTRDRVVVRTKSAVEGRTLPEGKQLFSVKHRHPSSSHLDFQPRGEAFLLSEREGALTLHDAATGQELRRVLDSSDWAGFDPTGRFLVACSNGRSLIWDLARNVEAAWAWSGRQNYDYGEQAFWSHDCKRLAVDDDDSTLVVEIETLSPATPQRDGLVPAASSCQFSSDGNTLIVDHSAGVSFWSVATGSLRRYVPNSRVHFVNESVVVCRRGDELLVLASDGSERWALAVAEDHLEDPCWQDSGPMLLARTRKGQIVGFSLEDGRERFRLSGARLELLAPDLFVAFGADRTLSLRSVESGEELLKLPAVSPSSYWPVLSPDRRWLAVYDRSGSAVDLLELCPGSKRVELHSKERIDDLRFSQDGTALEAINSVDVSSFVGGNSDPVDSIERFPLEPGECFLAKRGFGPSARKPRESPLKLEDFASELVWDSGDSKRISSMGSYSAIKEAVVQRSASGQVFVVDGRVRLFRLESAPALAQVGSTAR
jgi:WD40 repeat protein